MRSMAVAVLFLIATGCGGDDNCEPELGASCAEPTADAGKSCTGSEQCEGWCAAPIDAVHESDEPMVGSCSDETIAPCMERVEGGRYGGVMCI